MAYGIFAKVRLTPKHQRKYVYIKRNVSEYNVIYTNKHTLCSACVVMYNQVSTTKLIRAAAVEARGEEGDYVQILNQMRGSWTGRTYGKPFASTICICAVHLGKYWYMYE